MRILSEKSGSERKLDLENTGKILQSQIASVTVKEGNSCYLPLFSLMLSLLFTPEQAVLAKRERKGGVKIPAYNRKQKLPACLLLLLEGTRCDL